MSGFGGSGSYTSENLVIPYVTPSNVPSSLYPFINPIYIAFQNIIQTLIYYCGISPRPANMIFSSNNDPTAILANNTHRFYTQATENISAGAAINLTAVDSILQVRNANATDNTKPCDGFCSQSGGILVGQVGEVILGDGCNSNLQGLVAGSRYYLDVNSGNYTATPPTAAGNLQQSLGIALTTTSLRFWTGSQIQH